MKAIRDPACLYLELSIAAGAVERLQAAQGAARIEAVLLRSLAAGAIDVAAWRQVIASAQSKGAVALVTGEAKLARELGADGVHLDWSEDVADAYAAARGLLGPELIVGASAGSSRHDAMSLGEAGANYVAFPSLSHGDAARIELIEWWAEIFEVPCVALGVTDAGEAAALMKAGVDFVGVQVSSGEPPAATAALVRTIAETIGSTAPLSSNFHRSHRR